MSRRLRYWVLLTDFVWISAAVFLAHQLRFGSLWRELTPAEWLSDYLFAQVAALAIWAILYFGMKLDGFREGWHLPSVISKVAVGVLFLMTFLVTLAFFQKQYYSRLLLVLLAALLLPGLILIRCAFRFLVIVYCRGGMSRRVVILGNGRLSQEVEDKISRHPEMMREVIGFLYPSDAELLSRSATPVVGTTSAPTLEALELLQRWETQELVVVHRELGVEGQKLVDSCRKAGMTVSFVPQGYELYVSKVGLQEIGGLPLLSVQEHRPSPFALAAKRAVDLVLATLLLIVCCPLLATAVLALYWRRHKPWLVDSRCGKNGRPFCMYRLNVDRFSLDLHGYERVLARLSLTELPQLWNVLRGEMSIVGPRPESLELVKHYSDWQRQRLSVKPGLTGLAQVHGLREQHSSEEKSRFDMQYILHWSPLWDLALILETTWTLFVRLWSPGGVLPVGESKGSKSHPAKFSEVAHVDSAQSGTD